MGVFVDLTNPKPYHSVDRPAEDTQPSRREECLVASDEDVDRQHVQEDLIEDLEADKDSADTIHGGGTRAEITQDVTVNKAKTADKAFQAMDGYIRG
jgi:hypothetical protein